MKNTSLVQVLITITMLIFLVLLGVAVITKTDKPNEYYTPVPTSGPAPTMIVYPNNGKE